MNASGDAGNGLLYKILTFPLTRLAAMYVALTYLYLSGYFYRANFTHGPWEGLWGTVLAAIMMLSVYWVIVYATERRTASELALRPMPRELGLGLLLGFLLYTACILVLMAVGAYRIHGFNEWHILLPGMAVALATGVFEELFFRGGVFRIAEEWIGSWGAVVLSGVVFGFVHMGNEAASMQGLMAISTWAGLLLSATFLLTRRLWLGIGLHAAWNYTQGSVYSGIVSGNTPSSEGFTRSTIEGPEWITGGSFGVEASVVPLVLCTAVAVWMLVLAKRRGHIVPPRWKRKG